MTLKRTTSIAICILLLCSLILLVNVGAVKATAAGYDITEYFSVNAKTADGKWTTADEWHDGTTQRLGTPQVCCWEYMIDSSSGAYLMNWLIEFADTTNDAGDRWQICFDGANAAGSAAPTADCNKFEVEGHTTLKTYVGTGTAWASMANPTVTWKDTLTTSPHDPATHYVFELQFDKGQFGWGANPPPQGIRVAMYDASKPAQGWVSWPPTSTDTNPAGWGQIATYDTAMGPAPEGLTIGLMLALSSVAVVVSARYFRKPKKL